LREVSVKKELKSNIASLHSKGMKSIEIGKRLEVTNSVVNYHLKKMGLKPHRKPYWHNGWEKHIKEMIETGTTVLEIVDKFEAPNKESVYHFMRTRGIKLPDLPLPNSCSIADVKTPDLEFNEPHYLKRRVGTDLVVMSHDHYLKLTSSISG
jgi:hypothetical protein